MVEVYAMVRKCLEPTGEAAIYAKELRRTARDADAVGEKTEAKLFRHDVKVLERENAVMAFCCVKLVQTSGRKGSVPVPKWEVVREFLFVDENVWDRFGTQRDVTSAEQFEKRAPNDPYGDARRLLKGHTRIGGEIPEPYHEMVSFPRYLEQWEYFLRQRRFDQESIEPLPYLPLRHPIDDKRLQLRQIRFLFPETATMPLFAALDYVRERM